MKQADQIASLQAEVAELRTLVLALYLKSIGRSARVIDEVAAINDDLASAITPNLLSNYDGTPYLSDRLNFWSILMDCATRLPKT